MKEEELHPCIVQLDSSRPHYQSMERRGAGFFDIGAHSKRHHGITAS